MMRSRSIFHKFVLLLLLVYSIVVDVAGIVVAVLFSNQISGHYFHYFCLQADMQKVRSLGTQFPDISSENLNIFSKIKVKDFLSRFCFNLVTHTPQHPNFDFHSPKFRYCIQKNCLDIFKPKLGSRTKINCLHVCLQVGKEYDKKCFVLTQ